VDLKGRRRSSLAALVGRVKLSPEQADALLAGGAAGRILDMLLAVEGEAERAAFLPDCFTPPDDAPPAEAAAAAPAPAGAAADATGAGADADAGGEELLWCTPAQMMNEIDGRLRALSGEAAGGSGRPPGGLQRQQQQPLLEGGGHKLKGEAYERALRALRAEVSERWLARAPPGGGGRGKAAE
jgi:hypothetical protein